PRQYGEPLEPLTRAADAHGVALKERVQLEIRELFIIKPKLFRLQNRGAKTARTQRGASSGGNQTATSGDAETRTCRK
ncbi:uncharacterized, partial [Tachysurus ichikawai]